MRANMNLVVPLKNNLDNIVDETCFSHVHYPEKAALRELEATLLSRLNLTDLVEPLQSLTLC